MIFDTFHESSITSACYKQYVFTFNKSHIFFWNFENQEWKYCNQPSNVVEFIFSVKKSCLVALLNIRHDYLIFFSFYFSYDSVCLISVSSVYIFFCHKKYFLLNLRSNNGTWKWVISCIFFSEKDVTRTDRTHKFFEGECNPNLQVLNDILMTYCMFNFDLGK